MTHEQREEYIRQAKRSFQNNSAYTRNNLKNAEDKGERMAGFWKTRLLVSVLIFVILLSMHQMNIDSSILSQEKIASMIEKDMNIETVQAWFEQ